MILEGKTVLVAGVGAGLGRHVVEGALRDGANVLLAARTEAVLEQTAKEVDPSGKRVAWHRTDISDAGDCQALVAVGEKRFGKVDALVQVAPTSSRSADCTTPTRTTGASASRPTCSAR
jgi:NAD(P)-dependent dehydrogenase (short-subunit alcohol dehydrogenase family)